MTSKTTVVAREYVGWDKSIPDESNWVTGNGESGLKGVTYDESTGKSRPWRVRKQWQRNILQKRFSTRAEAAEWYLQVGKAAE